MPRSQSCKNKIRVTVTRAEIMHQGRKVFVHRVNRKKKNHQINWLILRMKSGRLVCPKRRRDLKTRSSSINFGVWWNYLPAGCTGGRRGAGAERRRRLSSVASLAECSGEWPSVGRGVPHARLRQRRDARLRFSSKISFAIFVSLKFFVFETCFAFLSLVFWHKTELSRPPKELNRPQRGRFVPNVDQVGELFFVVYWNIAIAALNWWTFVVCCRDPAFHNSNPLFVSFGSRESE